MLYTMVFILLLVVIGIIIAWLGRSLYNSYNTLEDDLSSKNDYDRLKNK